MAEEEKETTTAESSVSVEEQGAPEPKKHKKGLMVLGIVVAVIVVAGAGMWVWHEQPSFCNAICHSPMDKYVEGYEAQEEGTGIAAHSQAGVTCLQCHTAELTTQISEGCAWLADNYPMDENGMLATGVDFASEEFCARSGCHDMAEVTESTWGFEGNDEKYNPHSSHQDYALECGDCHKVHETSTLVCNECHALNAPEGWEAPSE